MKKHLYFFLFLSSVYQLAAQQTSNFSQSADEFGLNNPAGLTIEEMRYRSATLSGYLRNQWWKGVGFPRAQAVSWLDARPVRYHYGAIFLSDKIGETRTFGLQGRYAHTLVEGLKVGISMTGYSQQINVSNLDQYDENDPLAAAVGEARWRLAVGAGAFYHLFERKRRTWHWFAGAAFRRSFSVSKLPGGSEPPAETDLFAQGGLGHRDSWLAGGRLRVSLHQPAALDVYARKYFASGNYFIGGIFTTDQKYQTAGIQAGFERELRSSGDGDSHYLALSLGFSKPLSSYIEGNNLIFDMRATWILEQGR